MGLLDSWCELWSILWRQLWTVKIGEDAIHSDWLEWSSGRWLRMRLGLAGYGTPDTVWVTQVHIIHANTPCCKSNHVRFTGITHVIWASLR